MTVWCRLSWRARFLNIGLLPISEDRATLGSDSSAVWGFAGGDAFGCRSFLMPGFSHVSVVFQPWEQGWPHYILCLIMGLTSEYVGTLGHDTPAISGQFRSAATLLETQVKKERFWEIDEEFLLEIGTCIGELMFAKLKVKTEQA